MSKTVFQESAAKVATGFFSENKIFENTNFGHVTKVLFIIIFIIAVVA